MAGRESARRSPMRTSHGLPKPKPAPKRSPDITSGRSAVIDCGSDVSVSCLNSRGNRCVWSCYGPELCSVDCAERRRPAAGPRFTQLQGQYLAFIYAYSRIFKRPPAEADMRRHFEVTAPTVHQMVLTLEKAGLITRVPELPEASNFWFLRKPFRFCAKTIRHHLCGTVLGPSSSVGMKQNRAN
jgi:hypothetical protein